MITNRAAEDTPLNAGRVSHVAAVSSTDIASTGEISKCKKHTILVDNDGYIWLYYNKGTITYNDRARHASTATTLH